MHTIECGAKMAADASIPSPPVGAARTAMIVVLPNYIPQPEAHPGNATLADYLANGHGFSGALDKTADGMWKAGNGERFVGIAAKLHGQPAQGVLWRECHEG